MDLHEIGVRLVRSAEEAHYQELMQQHHYLGALPKTSETLWYVATWREEWTTLLRFSALKCAARYGWIGWDFRRRYSRLKLIVNNSRFLILPDWHTSNLGSRVLSLCQRRLAHDWASFITLSVPTRAGRNPLSSRSRRRRRGFLYDRQGLDLSRRNHRNRPA